MELMDAYYYREPGEFQKAINRQMALKQKLPGVWVTQDGLALYPRQMRSKHLINCIGLTERRHAGINIRRLATEIINGTYRNSNYRTTERNFSKELRKSKTYIEMIREAVRREIL